MRQPLRVTLRDARPDDVALLREWRNDDDAVRFSATRRAVSEDEHDRWFANQLADPDTCLWVAEEEGTPVGQLRVDIKGDAGVISIAVAASARGRGVAQAMLRAALEKVAQQRPALTITAHVDNENHPSIHAFLQVGFELYESDENGFSVLGFPGVAARG